MPPPSAYTIDAPFHPTAYIQDSDAARVAAFQAAHPSGIEGIAPSVIAAAYPAGGPVGPFTALPWCFVETFSGAPTIDPTVGTGTFIDVVGATGHFSWITYAVRSAPAAALAPAAVAIAQRRWIEGFELFGRGEGNTGSVTRLVSRDASRTPDGLGFCNRGDNAEWRHSTTTYTGAGTEPGSSWERVYVRIRRYPSTATKYRLWHADSTGPLDYIAIRLTNTGIIELIATDITTGAVTIKSTIPNFPLNTWIRLDMFFGWQTFGAPVTGQWLLYKNGAQIANVVFPASLVGLGATAKHSFSALGDNVTGANQEIDYDDWMGAVVPAAAAITGKDFLSGSHMQHVFPNGFGAGHGLWTGDFRVLLQNPPFQGQSYLTSTNAADVIECATDADLIRERMPALGIVAAVVGVNSAKTGAGAAVGSVGYNIAGAGVVYRVPPSESVLPNYDWNTALYNPSGLLNPVDPVPLKALYKKGNDGAETRVKALGIVAEYLGSWGLEDDALKEFPQNVGIHNSSYLSQGLNRAINCSPPYGVVSVIAGTYVGNGTGQDIVLAVPAHFWWVRPLTGAAGGGHWFTSMVGTHKGQARFNLETDIMPQALLDSAHQAILRVAGANAQGNAPGVTYQYLAICDPAMRYLINGALAHYPADPAAVNPLFDPTFTPIAGFFAFETLDDTTGSASQSLMYKGPGHAADSVSQLDAAEVNNALTFGVGTLLTQATPFHPGTAGQIDIPYSAWRAADPCAPSETGVVFVATSYIGDNTASRDIALTLGGKYPLWVLVVPHNAASMFRDPSHTGTQSSDCSTMGLVANNGIIAGGLNLITVGITLNATGIVYDVLCIPGDAAGPAWSANGTFYPVGPAAACSSTVYPCTAIPPTPPTPPTPGAACADDFPVDLS